MYQPLIHHPIAREEGRPHGFRHFLLPRERGKVAPKATEGGGHARRWPGPPPPPAHGWSPSPASRERKPRAPAFRNPSPGHRPRKADQEMAARLEDRPDRARQSRLARPLRGNLVVSRPVAAFPTTGIPAFAGMTAWLWLQP